MKRTTLLAALIAASLPFSFQLESSA